MPQPPERMIPRAVITDPRIGTELAGYRIETLVGRGGMSVVYLAEDSRLKRKVALKLLAPELGESERFRERFVRESQLAASLDHPNIIPIFEAGEADGLLYIAMRYVKGTDLKALIEREGALPPDRTLRLLTQVGSALDTAHSHGLIHRDVKPANILIAEGDSRGQEHVYLSDFGLTKRSTSDSGLTGTGQFVGTFDYAAPEQFEGKPLDARTDVYSLGCVLFECLTGERPFQRANEAALVYAHLMAPTPTVTEKQPDLPQGIDEVVAKAMAKAPENRYETAGQTTEAARSVLDLDRPLATLEPAPPPRGRQALLRRRAPFLAGAAALVIVAIVIGALLAGRDGASPPPGSPSTIPLATADRVARISEAKSTGDLARILPVKAGGDPSAIAVGEGSVWVTNRDDGTVSRIDPVTNESTTIKVGGGPYLIAVGEGSVWAVNRLSRSVSRIDPGTDRVVATVELTGFPSSIVVGEGGVWVAVNAGFDPSIDPPAIHRIDPRTTRVIASIELGGVAAWPVLTSGEGAVWAIGYNGQLLRIDPGTNLKRRVATLGISGAAIAFGDGALWIAGAHGGIVRVDPATGSIEATVPGGGTPEEDRPGNVVPGSRDLLLSMTFADGIIWVTGKLNGTIDRILANGNTALVPISVGQTPTGVAVGYGSVWVTVDTNG
jgi:YVTN family beta-propeller protein